MDSSRIEALRARMGAGALVEPVQSTQAGSTNPGSTNPYGLSSTKGQAYELLGKAVSPIVVARTLQISPALISQYLAEPEFKAGVRSASILRSTAVFQRDQKIDDLEDRALRKLGEVLDFITKPMELVQVAKVLNGMERRAVVDGGASAAEQSDTVVLQLPKHVTRARVELQFNTVNEVVEVNGRELRTMPATQVMKNFLNQAQEVLEVPDESTRDSEG